MFYVDRIAGFGLAALAVAGTFGAAPVARLEGWEGVASTRASRAGASTFQLTARASWAAGAAREPGRYAVRSTGPDGRASTSGPLRSRPGRVSLDVPADSVRNLRPGAVRVRVELVEVGSGEPASNALFATIEAFPHPSAGEARDDPGPFGWGRPLDGPAGKARALPNSGPDGFFYVRVPATTEIPAFFVATTEAEVGRVSTRVLGYDPNAGRSDEFALDAPGQPAIGLSPGQARAYLEALGRADRSGITYRPPTRAEWLRAARAGMSSQFWWGDSPTFPAGANFIGPEPPLAADSTAPSRPTPRPPTYRANPWGLVHTFGNADEWAVGPSGEWIAMGGNFRTEPEDDSEAVRDVPYVSLRPTFTLDREAGGELIRNAMRGSPALGGVRGEFDPDRATATLSGTATGPEARREAGERLRRLWFLAAVVDRIEAPAIATGQLARLIGVEGPGRREAPAGRTSYRVPVGVRFADPLPVQGSDWWVNVYAGEGRHFAHRMIEARPGGSRTLTVAIDAATMRGFGLQVDAPVSAALSLGGPAASPDDARIVSNVAPIRWTVGP